MDKRLLVLAAAVSLLDGYASAADCTVEKPCPFVRQWFDEETKRAEQSVLCHPVPLNFEKCRALEANDAAFHRLSLDYVGKTCQRFAGFGSKAIYPYFGQPEIDKTETCGPEGGQVKCRQWMWTWAKRDKGGSFGVRFVVGKDGGWVVDSCMYCNEMQSCLPVPFEP